MPGTCHYCLTGCHNDHQSSSPLQKRMQKLGLTALRLCQVWHPPSQGVPSVFIKTVTGPYHPKPGTGARWWQIHGHLLHDQAMGRNAVCNYKQRNWDSRGDGEAAPPAAWKILAGVWATKPAEVLVPGCRLHTFPGPTSASCLPWVWTFLSLCLGFPAGSKSRA